MRIVNAVTDQERKRAVRRTTLWTSLLALAFYLGFILLGVLNSR